jgi:hypothetical protein
LRVSQALERVRQATKLCRQLLEVGAVCLNWARTDLCGGGWQQPSLPRTLIRTPSRRRCSAGAMSSREGRLETCLAIHGRALVSKRQTAKLSMFAIFIYAAAWGLPAPQKSKFSLTPTVLPDRRRLLRPPLAAQAASFNPRRVSPSADWYNTRGFP